MRTSRLTPREQAIYDRLTMEAARRGLTSGELACIIIARMEDQASAGIARLEQHDNPRPLIGHWQE